jgi:hypothetical protein
MRERTAGGISKRTTKTALAMMEPLRERIGEE